MKKHFSLIAFIFFVLTNNYLTQQKSWIRINQLGYLPGSIKIAVLVSKENYMPKYFELFEALTDKPIKKFSSVTSFGGYAAFNSTARLNFSEFNQEGAFYIKCGDIKSPAFRISKDVYNGTADFLLNYMRQQRCGYNPFLKDSCHTHDGYIIYHPTQDSSFINVVGGWHDASDYLQYVTTSANAVFQMLFAYQQNPECFSDFYDCNGNKGSNGIPDILDEAKWGLDWLVKMNPDKNVMFNQIADDRDHRGFRLPTEDTISYGKGLERPVYFINGKPQGIYKYKNRTVGVASTAAKYASAFTLGSQLLAKYYPEFSITLKTKARDAYEFGLLYPGQCQTAPCRAPYFYEEDNYVDDMELAATQLEHYDDAVSFGRQEISTPWMISDTAKHYQWYPFINLGHYYLAKLDNKKISGQFIGYIKQGLDAIYSRGKENAFFYGVPFIWCSNNLVAAALTQARLYHQVSRDRKYLEMESLLRDWLFGCNPWGTSMIYGLPKHGDTPTDPHSAFTHYYNYQINGGLVDGPVYGKIFKNLLGITLYGGDEYSEFQSDLVVYHDDYGDYSTNEPTMDGTASLSFYLSSLQKEGKSKIINDEKYLGGIIRLDKSKKEIFLVFTGHEFADGGEVILKTLKKHNVKASFFLTGHFYGNKSFDMLIKKIKKDGHYLGAHSFSHLLYCDWTNRDSLLISKEQFLKDLKENYWEMKRFGVEKEDAKYFMPPYEWYNETISMWCNEIGLKLINFTSGTSSNADYTTPEMKNYISSEKIYNNILEYEIKTPNGLNGFILLTHIGTHPDRKDKFYHKLDDLIYELKQRGYLFKKLE
jgi:peptidoglycan/xylan/chitin deacetylase (PgdA/CDA1 family)